VISVARAGIFEGAFERREKDEGRTQNGRGGGWEGERMGLAAVIFLSGRTMAPLNARRFAREYTIFKKSPRTTLAQDLRRAFPPPGQGKAEARVNPSMASNGRILRTEKRPFKGDSHCRAG